MKSLIRIFAVFITALFFVSTSAHISHNEPYNNEDVPEAYKQEIEVAGYKVIILSPQDGSDVSVADTKYLNEALTGLRRQIEATTAMIPTEATNFLQENLTIELDHRCEINSKAGYAPERDTMFFRCFEWLSIKFGDRHASGTFNNEDEPSAPTIFIHEHDLKIPDGFDNETVKEFHEQAVSCWGTGEEGVSGSEQYWERNAGEFFAVFTESFFMSTRWIPYSYWDMDETYWDFMRDLWDTGESELEVPGC